MPTTLTNRQAIGALNAIRAFDASPDVSAQMKYPLAIIAVALEPHARVLARTQQQLQTEFLGDDASKATSGQHLDLDRALAALLDAEQEFVFTPIAKDRWEAMLKLPKMPCPIEPLIPLLAPDPATAD